MFLYSSVCMIGFLAVLSNAFVQNSFGITSSSMHKESIKRRSYHFIRRAAYYPRYKTLIQATQEEDISDEDLLQEIDISMLQDLCEQNNLSLEGGKEDLLARLRNFASQEAEADKERRVKQKERIESGFDDYQGNGKAKHRISSEDMLEDEDDEVDGVFYFSLPGQVPANQNKTLAKVTTTTIDKSINPQNDPRNSITAPLPPPGVEPNEDGEIVVTTYSSTDQNDLTGIAAQQAAASGNERAMAGGYSRDENIGGVDLESGAKRKKATEKEFDDACDVISELVYSLLSMTGAPGFQEEFSEGVTPFMTDEEKEAYASSSKSASAPKIEFTGFDPSRVPTQLITQASTALRVNNGDALRKVLNEVEMQAIGFDGMNGDDKEKGGGHYNEVTKVGTFLEGFRKAEVRRIARETATMLLDQLVSTGVKGLDEMLMTMTRGGVETGERGELNDSLVRYLDDSIRDQEKRIEQMIGQTGALSRNSENLNGKQETDNLSGLWNVTRDEKGNVVEETLDPNNPQVKKALEAELKVAQGQKRSSPTEPAQQLLNLLILLRERVKAEAVFTNDEKGRNLRMLAYCIHAENDREREKIIVDTMGNSLDVSISFKCVYMICLHIASIKIYSPKFYFISETGFIFGITSK